MPIVGIIQLIIVVIIFAIAIWGGALICERYKMPDPVFWLVGGLLLIILLLFVANQLSTPGGILPLHK